MFTINRNWPIALALGVLLLLVAGCGGSSRKIKVRETPPQLPASTTTDHTPAASTTTQQQAPKPAEHGPSTNRTAPLPPPGH